jgi:4-diphosphocytidyl-2C-methyl-D-erythritol kinase
LLRASRFRRLRTGLEAAALSAFPWLADTRARLTDVAGRAPTLSGSGSTWWFACASAQEAADLEARLIAGEPQCRTFRTATYRGGRRP